MNKIKIRRIVQAQSFFLEQTDSDDDASFDMLMEMFSNTCSTDVRQCLNICRGDVDAAAQLLLQGHDYHHHHHPQITEQSKVRGPAITYSTIPRLQNNPR
jgi:hypothetical protein